MTGSLLSLEIVDHDLYACLNNDSSIRRLFMWGHRVLHCQQSASASESRNFSGALLAESSPLEAELILLKGC